MTFADSFDHPDMHKQIDAATAASALHEVFSLFGDTSLPGNTSTMEMDSATPDTPTPSTTTSSGTTGEATSSPVPVGTAHSGEYLEDRGGRPHPGVDLAVPVGSQILAANSGTITHATDDDPQGYGNMIEITGDDGIITRYGHMSAMNVQQGARVRAGQVIGQSGGIKGAAGSGNSGGPHLHFEVRQGDHTIDPTPFLAGGYQVVGGVSSDTSTPTTADPKTLAHHALKNVISAISGQPMEDEQAQSPDQTATSTGSTSDSDPGAVNAFLSATKQHESGGDYTIYNQSGQSNASGAYQFLNSTWQGAGGSTTAAAQASPAEQDRVARNMALQLFNQFHSWRLVAIAWYGGPGIAAQVASGHDPGSPSGQGPYLAYGDTIAHMMQGGK